MVLVDETWVRWSSRPDPFARDSRAACVERNRDRYEALVTELLVQFLPDRQVVAASSPRSPADEEHLAPTVVTQPMHDAVQVGKGEVGGEAWCGIGVMRAGG